MFERSLKPFVGGAVVLIILREWRDGFFNRLKGFLKEISFQSYRGLVIALPSAVVLTLFLDPYLIKVLQGFDGPFARWIITFGHRLGRDVNLWIGLIGLYALASLTGRIKWRRYVFGVILGSLLTSTLAHFLKFVFLRSRPDNQLGPYSFFNFTEFAEGGRAFQSLPSGDVAVVAGASSCLFFMIPNRILRWFVFLLPLSTAFSRIGLNRHWPSDTVGSFMMSLIVAKFICDYLHRDP